MSYAPIRIELRITMNSDRRNRALEGWVAIVQQTQITDEKGQILCHCKASTSQEEQFSAS